MDQTEEVDEAIVEDEMIVEPRERQSLGSYVAETAELVEVAASGFIEKTRMDLRSDSGHP
jgi:hypothetical protein